MKIIKGYWSIKEEEKESENEFSKHLEKHKITRVFIGFEEVKNFKFDKYDGKMIMYYALGKSKNLKYYKNLLSCSLALNDNTAVFLQDKNYVDFKERILTKETINILKN